MAVVCRGDFDCCIFLTAIFGVSYQYGDTKNTYIKGASDIRFGIDIRGGVDVTFMRMAMWMPPPSR